jgi:hypothetical protein
VGKSDVENLVNTLYTDGKLGGYDLTSTIFNVMLPSGTVLSDQDTGSGGSPHKRHGHPRKHHAAEGVKEAVDSLHGLGGYHGSIHAGQDTIYYAVGVYSEQQPDGTVNGIPVFDQPWKNVVATFYHELNEARTDLQVEDVNATGNDHLLGWYSPNGQGEIGDLPINACGGDLSLVFKEVTLASGGGTVPIQLMWSNDDAGPAASTGQNVH